MCDRFACRAEGARRQQREEARIEELRRDAAREALRRTGVDPEEASWSLTPSNPAPSVPLATELRDEFTRHLGRVIAEAVQPRSSESSSGSGLDEDGGRFPPPGPDERRALATGCATCRGWCCRRGGTHAFLDAARIRRLFREHPELTESAVVDLYRSHLGDRHLEGGCVFQGETGCELPREIRGDTCNRYHCPDLVEARRGFRRDGGMGKHHFVAIARPGDPAPRTVATDIPDLGLT